MDEVYGRVGGRLKISITDSTMMWILHSAMNKAHERVQSKEGAIERLNEISKFYELAVMQLDGCLKFVQEETDSGLESSDEELLGDLTEIRDRLEVRLRESELAILEKDRELTERMENELKLTKALEIKEKELISLRADLKLERTKSDGTEEFIVSEPGSIDEDREEEFSELKNSVDQQVWNIKQKLGPSYKLIDRRRNKSCNNIRIEQMRSDIDILKETMDFAFGKMQSAMFSSELEPVEQRWRWTIEKDATAILINGFVRDMRGNFEADARRREQQVSMDLSKQLSDLMKEIKILCDELECLTTSQNNLERKNSVKIKRRSYSEGDVYGNPDDPTLIKHLSEGDLEDDSSHYVAKMIKNHEKIIRTKSEELNWPKPEILGEKRSQHRTRERGSIMLRKRIQKFIVRLENIINWNAKLGEAFGQYGIGGNEEIISVKRSLNFDRTEQVKSDANSLEDAWDKVNEKLRKEIGMLHEEKEDTNLKMMIMEETYAAFLEGLKHESSTLYYGKELEILTRDNMHEEFLKEMKIGWKEKMERDRIEFQIREEMWRVIFNMMMENYSSTLDSAAIRCQDARAKSNCLHDSNLEGKLREEISTVFRREMWNEWNEGVERYTTETLVREELHLVVFEETLRDIANIANNVMGKCKEVKILENFTYDFPSSNESLQCIKCSVKENVFLIFLKEMFNEWKEEADVCNIESLIKEELNLLVMVETVKEATSIHEEAEDSTFADKLNRRVEAKGGCSEMKQYNNLVGRKHRQLNKSNVTREVLTQMKSTSTSVSGKIEKALQQLTISKGILHELRSSLGIADEHVESFDYHNTPTVHFVYNTEPCSSFPAEEKEEEKIAALDSALTPIMSFSHIFMEFECQVAEKLRLNTLRLEEAIHRLDPLPELVASLKRKERVHRDAFKRRCEDLRMAETEVDLLGDQVDQLQDLLEKIYKKLHQHSPALQQYFEVSDILTMIGKELFSTQG